MAQKKRPSKKVTAVQIPNNTGIRHVGRSKGNDEFLQLRKDWLKILNEDLTVFKRELLSHAAAGVKSPIPLINSKINAVMAEIHAVAKTHRFQPTTEHAQGFEFRKIDELIAELNPILVNHRLFYHPAEIKSFDQTDRIVTTQSGLRFAQIYTRLRVRWKITCALDGSFIDDVESVGEGVSEQQFSTNAALTMSEKAMLCDIFCIPVYGDRDPEAENPARAISATAIAPAETAPSTDAEAQDDRQPGLFQEPASSGGSDGKRAAGRKREPKEPQIAAAGGAAVPETTVATNGGPMTAGLLQIIRTNLKGAKKEEKDLCAHFQVEKLEVLGKDKMAEVTAWIQG